MMETHKPCENNLTTPRGWTIVEASQPESQMNSTTTVRTNEQLHAMDLSFYTLCHLARVLECVDPRMCLEHRLAHPAFADKAWKGELTLDRLGNFVSFS